jgi:hypothetical protein
MEKHGPDPRAIDKQAEALAEVRKDDPALPPAVYLGFEVKKSQIKYAPGEYQMIRAELANRENPFPSSWDIDREKRRRLGL